MATAGENPFWFSYPEIDRREPGKRLPYELVRERVAHDLQQAALAKALTHYLPVWRWERRRARF